MDPAVVGVFIPIVAIIGFFGLRGLKTWSTHQLRLRETPGGDNDRRTETGRQGEGEAGTVGEEGAERQERGDSTERMLSEVRSRNVIGPGDST